LPVRPLACFAINKNLSPAIRFHPPPTSLVLATRKKQCDLKLARTSKSAKRGANLAFRASGLNLTAFLPHFRKFIRDRILRMMRAYARILIKNSKKREGL